MVKKLIAGTLLLATHGAYADFNLIALGSKGGIQDGNLTAFMMKSEADNDYIMLDAGALVSGLIAAENKALASIVVPDGSPYTKVGYVLRERIKGYFISHAHLDHLAGMVIASPDDSSKPIYSLASVNQSISDNYFNWESWPNFANEGEGLHIKKYIFTDLTPNHWAPVAHTSLQVLALPLAHSGMESTAFVFKNSMGEVMAYLGDTGPDKVEKSNNLDVLWTVLAKYAKKGKLAGIVIEVSYDNSVPDSALYGHLTPHWLLEELSVLAVKSGGSHALKGLNVVVSHIKYSLKKGERPEQVIVKQLAEGNQLGVNFIFPKQGDGYRLEAAARE
ncbi:MBL fold metallo-hydrolase [Photobacterium nomapromontoriensis]|uniref:MBL fold metallo-hydrolase n=1 Tax=Photobacterium nomapromontoriensis TaxID=2910237 RepID=UPI003D0995E0